MRSLSELFEFLNHCDKETLLKELNDHCEHLVQKAGERSIRPFKFDVENLNSLFRLSDVFMILRESPGLTKRLSLPVFIETHHYLLTTFLYPDYQIYQSPLNVSTSFPGISGVRKSLIEGFTN